MKIMYVASQQVKTNITGNGQIRIKQGDVLDVPDNTNITGDFILWTETKTTKTNDVIITVHKRNVKTIPDKKKKIKGKRG